MEQQVIANRRSLVVLFVTVLAVEIRLVADESQVPEPPGQPASIRSTESPVETVTEAPDRLAEFSEAKLRQRIADLSDKDFRVRSQASRDLAGAGEGAVLILQQAALQGDLEQATRIIQLLKRQYSERSSLGDAASEALEELNRSPQRDVALTAQRVLQDYADLRDERALTKIRQLGAKVKFHSPLEVPGGDAIAYIILVPDWTGGDDGLKYVKRLSSLNTLYVIRGTKVTNTALEDLYGRFPALRIQQRGNAYLGIASDRSPITGSGCVVTKVEPGSAADEAGMMEFDIIRGFNGTDIKHFDHLIEEIQRRDGGDEIDVAIERRGLRMNLKVKLGTWSEIQ